MREGAGNGFDVGVLTDLEDLSAVAPEWERCLEEQPSASYVQSPVELARTVADQPGRQLLAVTVREHGRLVAAAPFVVQANEVTWSVRGPSGRRTLLRFPVRTAQLSGEYVVGDHGAPQARHVTLLDGIGRVCRDIDVVDLRRLAADSALYRHLDGGGRVPGRVVWQRSEPTMKRLVRVDGSYDDYFHGHFSKKTRANVRREWRRLQERSDGPLVVDVVTTPEQVPDFLRGAVEVFGRSWHHHRGAAPLVDSAARRAQMTHMAEQGWLRCYLLRAGDHPLAFVIGYQSYGCFVASRTAYDEGWAEWSPGKALWHRLVQDLHEAPEVDVLDFGHGDWEYKRILANAQREAVDLRLVSRRPRTLAVHSGPMAWTQVRRVGDRVAGSLGVLDDVQRWTRKRMHR